MKRRMPGQATPVPKRSVDEDDLLAAIRDVHVRILALFERQDFCQWVLSEDPDPDTSGFLRTIEDLRDAERLFYALRAGRAITVAEGQREGDRMAAEEQAKLHLASVNQVS
jgi:hypothetical protein